jgi:hypothetical protein
MGETKLGFFNQGWGFSVDVQLHLQLEFFDHRRNSGSSFQVTHGAILGATFVGNGLPALPESMKFNNIVLPPRMRRHRQLNDTRPSRIGQTAASSSTVSALLSRFSKVSAAFFEIDCTKTVSQYPSD